MAFSAKCHMIQIKFFMLTFPFENYLTFSSNKKTLNVLISWTMLIQIKKLLFSTCVTVEKQISEIVKSEEA